MVVSARPSYGGHPPRKRGIQYAAAYPLERCGLWDTGSAAFADDDSGKFGNSERTTVLANLA